MRDERWVIRWDGVAMRLEAAGEMLRDLKASAWGLMEREARRGIS